VPTIVGETFEQRKVLGDDYDTLDNEISQIAIIAAEKKLSFGCLHFCTDLVRLSDDAGLRTRHDLERNEHEDEKKLLQEIFHILSVHLQNRVPPTALLLTGLNTQFFIS